MRAMILAAGRGERLRPLTDTTPKPLLEVGGKALIEYHLAALSAAGFREIVINLSHLGEQIRNRLGDGSAYRLSIRYSDEPPGALETGGGIKKALPLLGAAPFAVINADVFTAYPLARLRAIKCDHVHLVMVNNPAHHPNGDFGLQGGYVTTESRPYLTYSGISVYHPRFFETAEDGRYSVVPMWREAMARRQVTGERFSGSWHDIGTPERLEAVRNQLGQV